MTFRRWLLLVGFMTVLGMVKVAQQTAVCLKAYDVGRQRVAAHREESDTRWLQTTVIGLESPVNLALIMKQQQPNELVAWSMLSDQGQGSSPLIRLSQLLGSGMDD